MEYLQPPEYFERVQTHAKERWDQLESEKGFLKKEQEFLQSEKDIIDKSKVH